MRLLMRLDGITLRLMQWPGYPHGNFLIWQNSSTWIAFYIPQKCSNFDFLREHSTSALLSAQNMRLPSLVIV